MDTCIQKEIIIILLLCPVLETKITSTLQLHVQSTPLHVALDNNYQLCNCEYT